MPSALVQRWRARIPEGPIALAWTPDESGLVVATRMRTVVRLDTARGWERWSVSVPERPPQVLARHQAPAGALAFSGPQRLYSCGEDGRVVRWVNMRGWICDAEARVDGALTTLVVRGGVAAAGPSGVLAVWER